MKIEIKAEPGAFKRALEAATAAGHVLEHDPPHSLASVDRCTCAKCGCAVLGNFRLAYGSATEKPCTNMTCGNEH